MVKYEIKHHAVTRNNNADEPSPEHGSRAEEREMSGKPILTVDKNYICSKNVIYTNEQLQILKYLEEVTTGKLLDQDSFQVSPQVVKTP